MAHPSEPLFFFNSTNPNVYHKISIFSDPQLKKQKGEILPQHTVYNRTTLCQMMKEAVFKIADKGLLILLSFSDVITRNTRKKQDMWLKPGFKVYDRPLINGAKKKIHLFLLIQKVTVLRTKLKALRDEFVG